MYFCAEAQNAPSVSFNLATFLISASSCTNASCSTRPLDKYFILLGFQPLKEENKVSCEVAAESDVARS